MENKNYPTKEAHEKYLAYQREYYRTNRERFALRDQIKQQLYPEKMAARQHARTKVMTVRGYEKHHWSYNEVHWADIIYLTKGEHKRVHTQLLYNKKDEFYYFVDKNKQFDPSGFYKLDTKFKHWLMIINILGEIPKYYRNNLLL